MSLQESGASRLWYYLVKEFTRVLGKVYSWVSRCTTGQQHLSVKRALKKPPQKGPFIVKKLVNSLPGPLHTDVEKNQACSVRKQT